MKKVLLVLLPVLVVGFVARGSRGGARPSLPVLPEDLVVEIGRGERIDLEAVLDDEAWTLLVFGADW